MANCTSKSKQSPKKEQITLIQQKRKELFRQQFELGMLALVLASVDKYIEKSKTVLSNDSCDYRFTRIHR